MVDHDINHEVHISLVQGIGKRNQVIRRAKVWVEFVDVLCPIAMVSFSVSGKAFNIVDDR